MRSSWYSHPEDARHGSLPGLEFVAAATDESSAGVAVVDGTRGVRRVLFANETFCAQAQSRLAAIVGVALVDVPGFGAELEQAAEAAVPGAPARRRIAYRNGSALVAADVAVSSHAAGVAGPYYTVVVSDAPEPAVRVGSGDAEARLLRAARASGAGHWDWDLVTGHVWYEARFKALLRHAVEELADTFSAFQELVHGDDRPLLIQALRLALESRQLLDIVVRVGRPDTGYRSFRVRGDATRDPAGRPLALSGTIVDVTREEEMRRVASREQESLRRTLDGLSFAVGVLNARGELVEVNQTWRDFAGDRALIGLRYGFGEDYATLCRAAEERCAAGPAAARGIADVLDGLVSEARLEYAVQGPSGPLTLELTIRPLDVDGRRGAIVTHKDVTALRRAHDALRETKDFYELVLDSLPLQIAYVTSDLEFVYANHAYERWFRLPLAALAGRTLTDIVPPDRFHQMKPRIDAALAGDTVEYLTHVVQDGEPRDLAVSYLPHRAGEAVVGFFSVVRDVTVQHRLESELLHRQKMEAIGQLTGGIAHDFNNLLSVIIGNLQLLERPLAGNAKLIPNLATALRAALRGADLTRRLLSFSRQLALEPQTLNPSQVVADTLVLLKRTLGADIELRAELAADAWPVFADPGYLESSVLNLAINSRDAMPAGGCLTLATRNVRLGAGDANRYPKLKAGDYVEILVRDTGTGMTADVLKRAFEPFFTTKENGKGTGLGLSTVYGYAEQSGGTVTIDSEPGRGSTVRMLLPRSQADLVASAGREEAAEVPRGAETILVVDSDPDVRDTTVAALQSLGYSVLTAATGPEALAALAAAPRVALLLSELLLPGGMLGAELADRARCLQPSIRVLHTTAAALARRPADAAPAADPPLKKPFSISELGRRVRARLDLETFND
jgi:PAS domain S-box-containing protein